MIKLSANISKKVPIPNKEFSSQQFGAAMEVEISDADQPATIQARIRELYVLLSNTIDEQIAGDVKQSLQQPVPAPVPQPSAPPRWNQNGRTGTAVHQAVKTGSTTVARSNGAVNGNGHKPVHKGTTASEAQCRAIFAICKSMNLDMAEVLADYNVGDASELAIKDASRLIDELKNRQGQQRN